MSERVTLNRDGSTSTEKLHTAGDGYHSSTEYQSTGVKVSRGMGSFDIQSPDQLLDNDIVNVSGMGVTAKMAREMGLLGRVFKDAPLSLGAVAAAREQNSQVDDDQQKGGTGHAEYDAVTNGLRESVADGSMKDSEAQAYEVAVGQIAIAGIEMTKAVETMNGIADGTIDANSLDANTRASLAAAERKVTETATKAAKAELGQEGFQFLSEASRVHPGVASVVRQFAIDRATGKSAGISWAEFAEHVRSELHGTNQ